jgi:hypothetical protein
MGTLVNKFDFAGLKVYKPNKHKIFHIFFNKSIPKKQSNNNTVEISTPATPPSQTRPQNSRDRQRETITLKASMTSLSLI